MQQRRLSYMDTQGILRRLREKHSEPPIAGDMKINSRTVQRYHEWANTEWLLSGELPDHEQLASRLWVKETPAQNQLSVEGYRQEIETWLKQKVRVRTIYARMKERGYGGSYSLVLRLVWRFDPETSEAVVRVETEPGVLVYYGYDGLLCDAEGELRKTWLFVATLSWSRHA